MVRRLVIVVLLLLGAVAPAAAHPVPFSYVDAEVGASQLTVTVVVHLFDVAHDLGVDQRDLLDTATLSSHRDDIIRLIAGRLSLTADGRALPLTDWSGPELLMERQSVRLRARSVVWGSTGAVAGSAPLFPSD